MSWISIAGGVAALGTGGNGLAGLEGMEGLAGVAEILGLLFTVLFIVWLAMLGLVVPWFLWRIKVYAKRQYLLTRRMFESARASEERRLGPAPLSREG
ncbi:MAG: hypothetical protein DYG94_12885 [Leptolyngbya sp. PLA3]|nr:MAG: hypothetical protein EDM82_12265 [Cyanobacteria bacterium CYA]MCE7969620.1 hypothetical protein [Leptolyngbya sp. PL-A3]